MDRTINSRRPVKRRRKSTFLRVMKELLRNPLSALCLAVVLGLILVMIFADSIVPYELGIKLNGSTKLLKPCAEHIFGCDNLGRDMFSRMVHGTRTSLSMGLSVTAVVIAAGTSAISPPPPISISSSPHRQRTVPISPTLYPAAARIARKT